MLAFLMDLNKLYFIFLLIIAFQIYYFQMTKLNIKNKISCLKVFKSNNFLGLLVFTALLVGKF